MPRTHKVEAGHEKTVPLSLPEVQLATANSIHGDEVDQDAVHMAVQGYQLLLKGSFRNSHSEVTRKLEGYGGYYQSLMREVAQVFGLENRKTIDSEVIKIGSSSESSESDGEETSEDDVVKRKWKKRRLEKAGASVANSSKDLVLARGRNRGVNNGMQVEKEMSESSKLRSGTDLKLSSKLKKFNRYRKATAEVTSLERDMTKEHDICGATPAAPSHAKKSVFDLEPETVAELPGDTTNDALHSVLEPSRIHQRAAETRSNKHINEHTLHVKDNVQDTSELTKAPTTTTRDNEKGCEISEMASPHKLKKEDILGILETLEVPTHFTVFSDTNAVRTMEEDLLPGTWMFNRKSLRDVDFLAPQESQNYFIIRCIDTLSCPFQTDQDQWQIVLIKDLKNHCESVSKRGKNEISSTKPSMFVFDSSSVGLQAKFFLSICNFINGVLRGSYHKKHNLKNPKKEDMQVLKSVLKAVTSNIVKVCMQIQPRFSLSGIYMIANILHLSKENNVELMTGDICKEDLSEKRELSFGSSKKKVAIHVSFCEIHAEKCYDQDFVEPIYAL